jgi:hypothetical protein
VDPLDAGRHYETIHDIQVQPTLWLLGMAVGAPKATPEPTRQALYPLGKERLLFVNQKKQKLF